MEKAIYTTPELAELLGVFHSTVRRWIERNQIKGMRVGRNYKIPAVEVIRVLKHYGIPLPETLERYEKSLRKRSQEFPVSGKGGSILQKLLVVEEIKHPAFILRRAAILGANQAFADLVGYSQTDLIGLALRDVIEEPSDQGLTDFAQKRVKAPEASALEYTALLRNQEGGKQSIRLSAGPVDHLEDIFLVMVRPE